MSWRATQLDILMEFLNLALLSSIHHTRCSKRTKSFNGILSFDTKNRRALSASFWRTGTIKPLLRPCKIFLGFKKNLDQWLSFSPPMCHYQRLLFNFSRKLIGKIFRSSAWLLFIDPTKHCEWNHSLRWHLSLKGIWSWVSNTWTIIWAKPLKSFHMWNILKRYQLIQYLAQNVNQRPSLQISGISYVRARSKVKDEQLGGKLASWFPCEIGLYTFNYPQVHWILFGENKA